MDLTLGEAADRLYQTRQARYAKQKEVDLLQEEETALKDFIINSLPKDTTGAQGRIARVGISLKTVYQLKDDVKFFKYVSRNKAWDLLTRRISNRALQERIDAGKRVPGVEPFTVVDVTLNKIPGV